MRSCVSLDSFPKLARNGGGLPLETVYTLPGPPQVVQRPQANGKDALFSVSSPGPQRTTSGGIMSLSASSKSLFANGGSSDAYSYQYVTASHGSISPPTPVISYGQAFDRKRAISPVRLIPQQSAIFAEQAPSAEVIRVVQQPQMPYMSRCHLEPAVAEMQSLIVGLQLGFQNEVRAREALAASLNSTKHDLAMTVANLRNAELKVAQLEGENEMMQVDIQDLKMLFQEEKGSGILQDESIRNNRDELETLKAHLSELDWFSTNDLQHQLHAIEVRGNIQVDFDTGEARLVRPISFVPKTTKDVPSAEFTRADVVAGICKDIADVMNLFACPISIEGHTKGGEGEFWQTLADARAHIVVQKIVEAGGDPTKISSCGRPGKLGSNETRTVVRLILHEEAKDSVKRFSPKSGGIRPSLNIEG